MNTVARHIAIIGTHRGLSSDMLAAALATGTMLIVNHDSTYDLALLEAQKRSVKMPEMPDLAMVEYLDLKAEREPWRRGRPLR